MYHGFGYVLDTLGLSGLFPHPLRPPGTGVGGGSGTRRSLGARLRLVLEELGPTFIKLGQVASTRPDMLPADVVVELVKLQDQVPPFPTEEARRFLEQELGVPLEVVFASFEDEPLAAASIGQVHRARLQGGQEVVVKIQRPGIREVIDTDLEILCDLARIAERRTPWGRFYSFTEMVEEFSRTLHLEMDYTVEGCNADYLRQIMRHNARVYIPRVYWDYTTSRVLVLEYIPGVKLTDLEELDRRGWPRRTIMENLAQAVFQQVLVHGFFHADPHPGNIAVVDTSRIVLMDFGMVGHLSPERRDQLIDLLLGLVRRSSRQIVRTIEKMGILGPGVDRERLRLDVEKIRARYYNIPFRQIKLGETITEILDLAFRYRVRVPTEFTLLAKALVTLEGVAAEVDPGLSVVGVAEPLSRDLVWRRLRPKELSRKFQEWALEYSGLLLEAPAYAQTVLEKVAGDRLTIRLEHQNLQSAAGRLDKLVNRLSFSIVLLAFSIVMSSLIIAAALSGEPVSFFFGYLPILEIGFSVATLMFSWLIYSIFRSGRL